MDKYSVSELTGCANGEGLDVSETSTPGNTVHTAVAGSSSYDKVYLWASNSTGSAVTLSVEIGSTVMTHSVAAHTTMKVIDGLVFNNGKVIRAFDSSGSAITLFGHMVRVQIGA